MIYSASRRTDLVRFHPDWLAGRIGRARKLEAVVYWTKDPEALVGHPGLSRVLERYPSLVHVTLTGRGGTVWEPGVRPPGELAGPLAALAKKLPPGAVRWRFDPILLDADAPDPEAEVAAFFETARAVWRQAFGTARETTASFLALYPAVKRSLATAGRRVAVPDAGAKKRILAVMLECLGQPEKKGGPPAIRLCCAADAGPVEGCGPAACVDASTLDRLYGTRLAALPRDRGQRAACLCAQSTDIGSYRQECGHRCLYCYARHAATEPQIGSCGRRLEPV